MSYQRDTYLPLAKARDNDPHAPANPSSPAQSYLDGSALDSSIAAEFSAKDVVSLLN